MSDKNQDRAAVDLTKSVNTTMTIQLAWWIHPYLRTLAVFYCVTGTKPNYDKLAKVIMRGVKCKVAT
jgi:hypothetical protein